LNTWLSLVVVVRAQLMVVVVEPVGLELEQVLP
jgi:hypothetical protein